MSGPSDKPLTDALANVHADSLRRAEQLKAAIEPFVSGKVDAADYSQAEFEARGVQEYSKVFGHTISERWWRKLFKRTVDRDNGLKQWDRLDLYLEEKPRLVCKAIGPFHAEHGEEFRWLHQALSILSSEVCPIPAEIDAFWIKAIEVFDSLVCSGYKRKKVRCRLLRFLWHYAPWLARNENALRANFDIKYSRWLTAHRDHETLLDGRFKKKGITKAAPFDQEDKDRLVWHAGKNCGGRLRQAIRELLDKHQLSEETAARLADGRVPPLLSKELAPEINRLAPFFQGPRAVRYARPYIQRNYDGIFSMDCVSADDFTLPVYWWVWSGDRKVLVRGQCLIYIDLRSLRILGFSIQPDRGYSAPVIRSGFTTVFSEHGVPKVLLLENGIWRRSKILKGSRSGLSWDETELGLREFGITFVHAQHPRAKVIERIGGIVQSMMQSEPGYCGSDERRNCPEETKRAKLAVEAGRLDAAEAFHSWEQWEERLFEIFNKYNATPQNGKILQGLSPDEAFWQFRNENDPPINFDGCRWLLANEKTIRTVTKDGVKVHGRLYYSEATGNLQGQKVLAWWDPQFPDTITLTDLNRGNPVCIPQAPTPNVLEKLTGLNLGTLNRAVAASMAHQAPQLAHYRVLKSKFENMPTRRNIISAETRAFGEQFEAQQETVRQGQRAEAALCAVAAETGVVVQHGSLSVDEAMARKEGLKKFRDVFKPSSKDR